MPKRIMISLVYTHQDFYIVDKPAGIGFHDEKVEDNKLSKGFFNLCCDYFSETLYPLHRLDKVTSGLLILGRNKSAANWFQNAFEQKSVEKTYLALTNCKPKKKQGGIIGDMSKARGSQWKLLKTKENPAKTQFFSTALNDETYKRLRLCLLKPKTGKTHQLRVALKSLSAPILGDELYGAEDSDRVYLHAYALKFDYKGEALEFSQFPNNGLCYLNHKQQIIEFVQNPFEHNWPES